MGVKSCPSGHDGCGRVCVFVTVCRAVGRRRNVDTVSRAVSIQIGEPMLLDSPITLRGVLQVKAAECSFVGNPFLYFVQVPNNSILREFYPFREVSGVLKTLEMHEGIWNTVLS